jgi:chemotaxis response regulator CheB
MAFPTFRIVVIGASAGGIEAASTALVAIDTGAGAAAAQLRHATGDGD